MRSGSRTRPRRRPGTDVLLLLALLHVVFEEGLTEGAQTDSLRYTKGVEAIEKLVAEFPPEKVAGIAGIDAEKIRALAREFAAAKSAVCYGRIGVSTQEFGGVCQWLINVLNVVTGNLDRPGGAMFPLPAFDPLSAPEGLAPRGSYGRWHSRVRKLPEFGGELPVVALAEEILTEGKGQIKALVTLAGNPVLSTPNGGQLDQALASLGSWSRLILTSTRRRGTLTSSCRQARRSSVNITTSSSTYWQFVTRPNSRLLYFNRTRRRDTTGRYFPNCNHAWSATVSSVARNRS